MFRVQDNVPEVYVNQSRDFQLFCHLYDLVFTGVRYSIDSMGYLTDSNRCNRNTVGLLMKKLGMFDDINISEQELKLLLSAFPSIIRNKGNITAIEYVIRVFHRIASIPSSQFFMDVSKFNDNYVIEIRLADSSKYIDLIRDILKYVVPSGYIVKVDESTISTMSTYISISNNLSYNLYKDSEVSIIAESTGGSPNILNDIGTTPIVDNIVISE
jgi:hypothetical protein